MKDAMPLTILFRMIKALMIAGLMTVLSLALLSFWMYKSDPGERVFSLAFILTYIAAGFLGGLYMGHKMDRRKFLWGMSTGLCYYLVLTILAVWVVPGEMESPAKWLSVGLLCLISGCIGGMLG